jgi:hypothetical protein
MSACVGCCRDKTRQNFGGQFPSSFSIFDLSFSIFILTAKGRGRISGKMDLAAYRRS